MTSKFMRLLLAFAASFAMSALAQTSSVATPSGAGAAPAPAAPSITGTKVGALNIEGAIFNSNEGRRDMEALQKKYEPKNAELKGQNDELDALKKQLTNTQDKLNPDALDALKRQVETKQKSFDRALQDFQDEINNQQQEIASRILGKLGPVIVKYASENGFGMIIDTSKPWPQGPVIIAGDAVDITKPVVEAYNAQSGVAAPAAAGAAKPAAPKPTTATPAPKPPATKPADAPK